ncbi:DUF6268 family outer membrane beta-barrel protein [Flavobacterium sp. CS20]|jgi:hypothetical protein|uniref:DUF6268 family outer membrane beta-barrel protein n=1 Tax=Flavobacterium sp. CS20 TaxID=2775246 RepID=UPI001B3A6CEB|nr:DUF6268 family outer membrane beta-barrel protein [Flavobacterium sp. CS20]QTY27186.1 hypothetical protein IGB25_00865 [Flavobacterium sp. CS20]
MKHYLSLIGLLFFIPPIFAQSPDIARVEYTWFPQEDSDNSFRRFKTFFNFPIKLRNKDILIPRFEYQNVEFQFNDIAPFDRKKLDRFQYYKASLAYLRNFKENWRYAAEAGVVATSNFQNSLMSDDIIFNGSVYVLKSQPKTENQKKSRLIFGLTFNTNAGRPFPLPFVNYFKEVSPKVNYTLGIPRTNIKYLFSPKHIVQAFATLDGFYANVQKDIAITQNNVTEQASELSMLVVLSGLGYEFKFMKYFSFYSFVGYTILNDIRLRDNDANDIYTINDKNSTYFRFGLKIKMN